MTTASKGATTSADVVVIGSGIAGDVRRGIRRADRSRGRGGGRVILIDRATKAEAGGLTKWTSAYLRIDDVYEPGESFVPDIVEFSDGRTPPQWYVEELAERLPETMEWIQTLGIRFKRLRPISSTAPANGFSPSAGGAKPCSSPPTRGRAARCGDPLQHHRPPARPRPGRRGHRGGGGRGPGWA